MKARAYKILILVAIVSQFGAYGLTAIGVKEWWYYLNATTHLALWSALFFSLNRHNTYIREDRWCGRLTMYGIMLASNQFFDEFILDPTRFHVNEALLSLFIIIHSIVCLIKDGKT